MNKLFLFSWAQLLKLIALLKPLLELIKSIIDVFKKQDNENEPK